MRRFLVLAALLTACHRHQPLPTLSSVPGFTLTAEDGRTFQSTELKGQVWVADLIFTSCPDICPRMSGQMKQVQDGNRQLKLISFTVDPERDTPPALAAYAKRHKADPQRWNFLTGERQELDKVGQAFLFGKIHLDHSSRFVLVDRQMRVRAFYPTDEPDAVARLLQDAARLQGQ